MILDGAGPDAVGQAACRQRNVVERAFCQLRQHRTVATRYDKHDFVWRGSIDVTSIRMWLRRLRLMIYGTRFGRVGN